SPDGCAIREGQEGGDQSTACRRPASSQILDAPDHQRCPAGLMTGAKAFAGFRMEVLVEQDQPLPVWIVSEAFVFAVTRASAGLRQKKRDQAALDFLRHLPERQ